MNQTLEQLRSGELAGTGKLKLSCSLTTFPQEIFSLRNTLEILDLSGNKLDALPDNLGDLQNLKILFLSDNLFKTVPTVLAECPKLEMIGFKANHISSFPEDSLPLSIRWLILTNNQIPSLPRSIGKYTRLQKVMFAGNRLRQLPEEMALCRNIELLRISANHLTEIPEWLLSLPRLAWLAFAGNPCSFRPHNQDELPVFSWGTIKLQEKLGEGASGIISKATLETAEGPQQAAVKVFKGEVTSDGLPDDEMRACLAAGMHRNLVKVLGKIENHPESRPGLVFSLIPSGYRNLGITPSFETCTRDVFAEGTVLKLPEIIRILQGISSVAGQLHKRGISHGDLYAHNILIDSEANPLFGDFGAGAFYSPDSPDADKYQKIEVRAFGYLMEDLLNLLDRKDTGSALFIVLKKLMLDCLKEDVPLRPSFAEIAERLELNIA